jgi:hypothetical protein
MKMKNCMPHAILALDFTARIETELCATYLTHLTFPIHDDFQASRQI